MDVHHHPGEHGSAHRRDRRGGYQDEPDQGSADRSGHRHGVPGEGQRDVDSGHRQYGGCDAEHGERLPCGHRV